MTGRPVTGCAVYVAHLSLTDFRSYAEVELAARAGRHRVRRAERPGQDQPGRGDRLPRDAGLAPGRHRRAAGAGRAPSGPSSAAAVVRDGRPTAGRARDQPGQGQPGPAQPRRRCRGRASVARRCCARCCSRPRTWRWSRATRPSAGASSTTCWWPAHAAAGRRARRLRPGAQAAQRPAEVGRRARSSAAAGRRSRRSDVWDAHLAAAGAELLAARLELVDDLRAVRRSAYA